jgi:trans-2,3-dihydro-3-hydroxyanthranilate isomerase
MPSYAFRILNVFAETTFGGNPLCVIEDAQGLDDNTMQALALQFNLSETTFIFPSDVASARVRIFTTGYEMRFAGHPTLGTAHVVRDLGGSKDELTLEMKAGVVPVVANGDRWTLTAPHKGPPIVKTTDLSDGAIAALVSLTDADLLDSPRWVDTGVDQLLIPLATLDAVQRATPDSTRFADWPQSSLERKSGYVFAFDPEDPTRVVCRYFFTKSGGGVAEDPGTGSACANLGGWLLSRGHTLPAAFRLEQGDAIDRPCRLDLALDANGAIKVGGRVMEIARGTLSL